MENKCQVRFGWVLGEKAQILSNFVTTSSKTMQFKAWPYFGPGEHRSRHESDGHQADRQTFSRRPHEVVHPLRPQLIC
ncbi:unnamed protein product [Vitrella brassicaformis CCMP3155]|uniref:Uncharacterized protein n=1 Tax=Vitrella brassicaformis (strain CCMP3155) TaxID=1169540 RepID=A0A0G4EAJ2_VITBC|nr:unnamed protein product [Vitrella brassicaformis CCMP3155]|eukprot:CEL92635.1 unnamed protein product [Vitrella brassicaformis CCMP3155]